MAQTKKKKRFFDVEIPLIKRETQLQAYEIEELNGRYINYDLTRILRGKNSVIQFKVVAKEKEATTIPIAIKLLPSFTKRMVRKGTDYVEDSLIIKCKDKEIEIKPLLITRRKVSRAIRKALREKARQELIEYAKEKEAEKIIDDILKNILQKKLSLTLKKIYPLSLCEIRFFRIKEK
jgi:ribosomal protein S3AE